MEQIHLKTVYQKSLLFLLCTEPRNGLQILLIYSQAGPGRKAEHGQDEISRNHVQTFFLGSVQVTSLRPISLSFFISLLTKGLVLLIFMATIHRFYRLRSKTNSSLRPTIIRSKVIASTVLRSTIFKSTQKFELQNCFYNINVYRINAYRYLHTHEIGLQD